MISSEIKRIVLKKTFENNLLTPINIFRPFKEPRDVVLQDGEGLVELLQDTNHSVMLLYILFGFPQGNLGIETTEKMIRLISEIIKE